MSAVLTPVLDLFRGAGGWSEACRRLDLEDHGVEIMPQANATAEAAGHKTVGEDVWTFRPEHDYTGLIASPPCQTFSQAGKGRGRKALEQVLFAIETGMWTDMDALRRLGEDTGDERTALVLTPLHYAHLMRPMWVALEQVPTVLPVWIAMAEQLDALGYHTVVGNLQAEQYGVPQTRKRAFLLAHRDRQPLMPAPTHSRYYPRTPARLDEGVTPWMSMAQALGWTEDVEVVSNYGTGGDPTNRGVRHGGDPFATVTSKVDRFKVLRMTTMPNSSERTQDQPAPTICFGNDAASARWLLRNNNTVNAAERELDQPAPTLYFGQRSNYCAWERRDDLPEWAHKRPSTTIVGTFRPDIVASPGYRTQVSRQDAPDSVRVSVAEAGILQSFRPDYPWQGTKSKQYMQVGNAVPPLLAEAVLRQCL